MRRRIAAFSLTLLAPVFACSASPSEPSVDADVSNHTEGDYVNANSALLWAESTYPEFLTSRESITWSGLPTALPDTDPLAVRLQTWLDRLDGVVRAGFKERNGGAELLAPRPMVRVLPSRDTFNAWVSGVPSCLGRPVGQSSADPKTGSVALLGRDAVESSHFTCVRPPAWKDPGALATLLGEAKSPCQVTVKEDRLEISGKSCSGAGGKADDLAFYSTSPYIHFSTDLLARLDEKTVAVVLAHELGHYYRAHVSPFFRHKYGFWFDRDAQAARRPVAAANAEELAALYRELVESPKPLGTETFATRYSPRLRPLLLEGLAPKLLERREPGFVCKDARAVLERGLPHLAVGETPTKEARAAFTEFEAKLAACAPKLRLAAEPGESALRLSDVLFAVFAHKTGALTLRLDSTLSDVLEGQNESAKKLDDKAARLVKRLQDNQIGLYTTEQEADDMALEFSTKIGLTAGEVLTAWVDFMRAIDSLYATMYSPEELVDVRKRNGDFDAETCKGFLDAGFMVDDGAGAKKPLTMKLGQLDEPHHASCYRLYNLWRESKVHKYAPAPAPAELTPSWSELRDQAKRLSGL